MTTVNRRVVRGLKSEHDNKNSHFDSPRETKPREFNYKLQNASQSSTSDDNYDPTHSDASSGEYDSEKSDSRREDKRKYNTKEKKGPLVLPKIDSAALISHIYEPAYSETENKKDRVEDEIRYTDYPIFQHIKDNIIGRNLVIKAPFGSRKVVYCDYTASGRCLTFIEDYIREHVFPTYANTHSSTGHNARQTGKFREEARSMIKNCVNASKDDVVIFTGSGATAGMHKLAWALKVNQPRVAEETVVFIGPYEHHSNILPWREYGTQVVRIRYVPDTGLLDLAHLQQELKFWKDKRRHMLVCMSAASNVTGIMTDVDAVSMIAHNQGAIAVFDYAAGGPYMKIDMNPSKSGYKDGVILSPHKFVGGPGTPGLLIAKKWIFKNSVPDRVGGGTVKFVTRGTHSYVSNIEEKEEGGTPAIIESIRAGLVFQLKEEVGTDVIEVREENLCQRAFGVWEKNASIYVLGNHTAKRVPIISFLTKHLQTGRLIHHNFISTLLSDLYGIQARGGCACAGPYAEDLMGISEPVAKKYLEFLSEKPGRKDNSSPHVSLEIMKPGFTRVNLAYFEDDETIDFIIEAVDMVTRHGWKLLPQYTFDMKSGSWKHKDFSNSEESELETLADINMTEDQSQSQRYEPTHKEAPPFRDVLRNAEAIFQEVTDNAKGMRISSASRALRDQLPKNKRTLKWFLTPYEAANILADKSHTYLDNAPYRLPFKLEPPVYRTLPDDDSDYHSDVPLTDRSDSRDERPREYKGFMQRPEKIKDEKSPRKQNRHQENAAKFDNNDDSPRRSHENSRTTYDNSPTAQAEHVFPDIHDKSGKTVTNQRERPNKISSTGKHERSNQPMSRRRQYIALTDRVEPNKPEISTNSREISNNPKDRRNKDNMNRKLIDLQSQRPVCYLARIKRAVAEKQ